MVTNARERWLSQIPDLSDLQVEGNVLNQLRVSAEHLQSTSSSEEGRGGCCLACVGHGPGVRPLRASRHGAALAGGLEPRNTFADNDSVDNLGDSVT